MGCGAEGGEGNRKTSMKFLPCGTYRHVGKDVCGFDSVTDMPTGTAEPAQVRDHLLQTRVARLSWGKRR